jgi:hypothetical protein
LINHGTLRRQRKKIKFNYPFYENPLKTNKSTTETMQQSSRKVKQPSPPTKQKQQQPTTLQTPQEYIIQIESRTTTV